MPYVRVSEHVKKKLEEIKKKEQHTSMDSVIRMLILVWERNQHGSRNNK